MQKFRIYGNLVLSHFKIPPVLSVLIDNFILIEVFENGSFNLHDYMDLTNLESPKIINIYDFTEKAYCTQKTGL